MKKILIALAALAIILGVGYTIYETNKPKPLGQEWYTLENITYDATENRITGTSSTIYVGEMVVYLPDSIDTSKLEDGQTVKVLGGPGMTMSLPPQLMNCTEIEIIK